MVDSDCQSLIKHRLQVCWYYSSLTNDIDQDGGLVLPRPAAVVAAINLPQLAQKQQGSGAVPLGVQSTQIVEFILFSSDSKIFRRYLYF